MVLKANANVAEGDCLWSLQQGANLRRRVERATLALLGVELDQHIV